MAGVQEKILNPNEYQKMILELDIENFELKTSSIFEARATLVNLERLEEDLQEIRRNISADMRAIKLKYLDHNRTKSSLLGSFALQKPKVSARRRSMHNKCDRELGPYKNLLNIIDDYLEQIEDVKDYINGIEA